MAPAAVLSLTPSSVLMVPFGAFRYISKPRCVVLYELCGLIAINGAGEDGLERRLDTDDEGNVVERG